MNIVHPPQVYAQSCVTDIHGRSVTMQSISSSLKVESLTNKICKFMLNALIVVAGNDESKGHYDRRDSQLPSSISTVYSIQFW